MMMMKWFLLLTALLPITPSWTEVVNSVSDCPGFLLEKRSPQIPGILEDGKIQDQNRYKLICQTFMNKPRYLTLYDTTNRIPVFSAYKFQEIKDTGRPNVPWKIEPQLLGHVMDKNMVIENDIYRSQANDHDYLIKAKAKDCNRGHLYPSCHAPETDDKKSTFTLTNIVPQVISFNNGSWSRMECNIKDVMEDFCINQNGVTEAFVVVGAKPSEGEKPKKVNDRVNIPDMLWSAFCCYSFKVKKWVAAAHWAPNTAESAKVNLQTKTVQQLNVELSKWKSGFNLFPGEGRCLQATVPDSGQDSNKGCDCPEPVPDTTAPPTSSSTTVSNIFPNLMNCARRGAAYCTDMLTRCRNNARQCISGTAIACVEWCRRKLGRRTLYFR